MKTYTHSLSAGAVASLLITIASACNPLKDSGCTPSNPALGKTVTVDFTKGTSSEFSTTGGAVTYNSNGAQLSVTGAGIAPTLISNWYIMFGRVEVVMQTAPGVGMVSSAILQSDDLDEIDWEILGATPAVAQTNYFGKGLTLTYDREVDVAATTSQTAFNTYVIDWDSERITWSVNGVVERTLLAANADANQYPQTPMQIKVGPWAGGDASTNQPGTVTWAGGDITWADGPFLMQVKSITVQDYSSGSAYQYPSNFNGAYSEIVAVNGAVGATAGAAASSSASTSSAQSSSASASASASSSSSVATSSASATKSSSASVTTSSGTAAVRTSSASTNSTSQAPFSNTTTTKASTTNNAAAQSASSARSSIASSVAASMGTQPAAEGLAGQVSAITATTLVTTSPGATATATQGSTVTSIVRAASSSTSSGTTKASSSATSASVVQQSGNAAVRGGMVNAGVIAGAMLGAAAYVL